MHKINYIPKTIQFSTPIFFLYYFSCNFNVVVAVLRKVQVSMKKAFAILVRVIQLVVLPLVVYVQLAVQGKVLMVSFEVMVMGMLQTLVDLLD